MRLCLDQRKMKGQQPQGKIVSEILQNFSPRTFPFKTKGFGSRRAKEKKEKQKEQDKSMLHVSCCTFVLLLLYAAIPFQGRKISFNKSLD